MKKRSYAFGIDKLLSEAPVESAGAITNLIPVLAGAIKTITSAKDTVQYPITQPQQMSSFAMGGIVGGEDPPYKIAQVGRENTMVKRIDPTNTTEAKLKALIQKHSLGEPTVANSKLVDGYTNQLNTLYSNAAKYEKELKNPSRVASVIGNTALDVFTAGEGKAAKVVGTIKNANNKDISDLIPFKDMLQYIGELGGGMSTAKFALGGTVSSNIPINVEDGEIMKLPNGQQVEMKGSRHEQGGIDTVAPEGTTIYSDRLKVNGKTLAERQKIRANKELKLAKLLKGNEADAISKNTLERVQAQNRQEDDKDKQMMAFANQMEEDLSVIDTFMNGGMVKSYANGTPYVDFYGNDDELYQYDTINNRYNKRKYDDTNKQYSWEEFKPDKTFVDNYLTSNYNDSVPIGALGKLQGQSDNFDAATYIPRSDLKGYRQHSDLLINPTTLELNLTNNSGKQYGIDDLITGFPTNDNMSTSSDTLSSLTDDTETDSTRTVGDKLGLASSIFSGVAPLATTIANRVGDKANTNFFKTVGTRALSQLDNVEANINSQQELTERENRLLTNTMSVSNRNNAGSVNTLRAIDSASTTQLAENNSKIVSNFLTQLSNVGGQKAQIMQQSDMQNAQAETQREENDKKDRDNYYSNLGRNLNNIGTVGQTQAKIMNEQQLGQDQMDVMSQMSAYGLKFKRVKGKLQLVTDNKTTK